VHKRLHLLIHALGVQGLVLCLVVVVSWLDVCAQSASTGALIGRVTDPTGAAVGYARTKLVGHHMDWLFPDKPAVNNLVEYEACPNHVLSKYNDPVIRNYDLSKRGPSVAIDIMRTHPLVIIGGLLRENPFFVPPDQFLHEMRERRSARKSVS
jgi:hypothetical protein